MKEGNFPLHFDAQGNLRYPSEQDAIYAALLATKTAATDLWLFSHGWNTNEASADATYHYWVTAMQECIQREIHDATYHPIFVTIYWPSLAWAEGITIQRTVPQRFTGVDDSDDRDFLGLDFDEEEVEIINEDYGELELGGDEDKEQAEDKRLFIEMCHTFMNSDDDNSQRDGIHLYDILTQDHSPTASDIEDFVHILYRYQVEDPQADISDESNIFNTPESVIEFLKEELANEGLASENPLLGAFRVFTFWSMKGRTAIVGQNGVAPFLAKTKEMLNQHNRVLRLHLLGHSFGAKLVSASVYALAQLTPEEMPLVNTLILLLGAFSQFSFSSNIPYYGQAGRYASLVERHLVANPIVCIYSRHDRANKDTYPWGMIMTKQRLYEIGGPDNRYGSIGANGAQGLDAAICRTIDLQSLEMPYNREQFTGISCLNVDGQHYINANKNRPLIGAHRDIEHPEIFHLALAISNR
jgi:hypothetical protein